MTCNCYTCAMASATVAELQVGTMDHVMKFGRYFLCAQCGNKRCPHATDHRHACTRSNKPGQPGSNYTIDAA